MDQREQRGHEQQRQDRLAFPLPERLHRLAEPFHRDRREQPVHLGREARAGYASGVGDDRDLDKVQSRRPGYVVLTTNLLIALSKVRRVATNIALVCLYTICSHPYEHELYILSQYQHL